MPKLASALLALDPQPFYDELAATVREFGFDARVEDTGGGVIAVVVNAGGREFLVGGVQDGYLVITEEGSDDDDGLDLSLAECVGRAIVNRINVDDLVDTA